MGQVFISYRHVEPDESLALALVKAIEQSQVPVFIDRQIEVGKRWVETIEREIRASSCFVVILSKDSILSDMVRQEVALAHELERAGKMRILPIRAGFEGDLPYDLASYLNPFQYAVWKPGEPFEPVCAQIVGAAAGTAELPLAGQADEGGRQLRIALDSDDEAAPLPAADPRLVMETGTVRLSSRFYVPRATDQQMEEALSRDEGETLVIKGSRQSGKSSLLARAHAFLHQRGQETVYLDFQRLDETHLETLGSLLRNLAARIVRALKTDVRPKELWDEDLGDKESFVDFMETAALAQAKRPILLCLDEVDRIFERSYRADFFAAVRGWHNNRAIDPVWDRLHLAIAHATDPTLWIDDLNQSPFNVGERLRLEDFSAAEISYLAGRHGVTSMEAVEGVRKLVGGQPYLARQALYVLAKGGGTIKELRDVAVDERGPFGDHLRQRLWALNRNPRLCAAFKGVIHRGQCDDEMDFQRLHAAGLIAGDSHHDAHPRCELYQEYFRNRL
ncbi:MAG: AAA-like domain-containing protein [Pseudomonadota bacterium]